MEKLLKKFGFDEREISVYKTCLEHELNTPSTIARNTGIKRTTVYLSIEKLKEKNLLHSVIKKIKSTLVLSPLRLVLKIILKIKKINYRKRSLWLRR